MLSVQLTRITRITSFQHFNIAQNYSLHHFSISSSSLLLCWYSSLELYQQQAGYVELAAHLSRHDWTIWLFPTRHNCAFCTAPILLYKDVLFFDLTMQLFSGQQCFVFVGWPCSYNARLYCKSKLRCGRYQLHSALYFLKILFSTALNPIWLHTHHDNDDDGRTLAPGQGH